MPRPRGSPACACGVRVWLVRGENETANFVRLGAAAICCRLEVVPEGGAPASRLELTEDAGQMGLTLTNRGETLEATVPTSVTHYCPPVPGLEKRYRNGGFYYVRAGGEAK